MNNRLTIAAAMLMLAAVSAFGAESMGNIHAAPDDQGGFYRANELSLDGFGTVALGKYTINHWSGNRVRHDARLGAGVGLSYFITRNIGIGADAYSENTSGPLVDSTSVNLIARFPLDPTGFAPYVFGGGGRQFGIGRVLFAQVGSGIEYRFTQNVGVFVDARWVIPDKTKYYGVARLGMRFAF